MRMDSLISHCSRNGRNVRSFLFRTANSKRRAQLFHYWCLEPMPVVALQMEVLYRMYMFWLVSSGMVILHSSVLYLINEKMLNSICLKIQNEVTVK